MPTTYSRINGWMPPPHPLQVAAWMVLLYLVVATLGVLAQAFASSVIQATLYVVLSIVISFNIVANVVCSTIDPADDAVVKKIRSNPRPGFDRGKHRHVIDENYFCNICETIIHPTSKHCRQCNKCVLDFDHHCKWLNNCVGAKNYRWFLVYVVSTVLASSCIFAVSSTAFAYRFVDRPRLNQLNGSLVIFYYIPVDDVVWLTIVGSAALASFVAGAMLTHLLFFHIKIIRQGTTTYNYIMEQRRKEDSQEREKEKQEHVSSVKNGNHIFENSAPKIAVANKDFLEHAQANNAHMQRSAKTVASSLRTLKIFLKKKKGSSLQKNANLLSAKKRPINLFSKNAPTKSNRRQKIEEALTTGEMSQHDYENANGKNGIRTKPAETETQFAKLPTRLPPIRPRLEAAVTVDSNGVLQQKAYRHTVAAQVLSKPKRAGTSVESPVPYEKMEDKENRVSVNSIAAALPSDRERSAGTRQNSAAISVYSRHADVPRLPPLTHGNATFQKHAKVNDSTPNLGIGYRVKQDDILREIPLTSLVHAKAANGNLQDKRSYSCASSSSSSSGSSLTPVQMDGEFVFDKHSITTATTELSIKGANNVLHVDANGYLALQYEQARPLPPFLHKQLEKVDEPSESSSLSSNGKRVRFVK